MTKDAMVHRHLAAILKSGESRAIIAVKESIEAIYQRQMKRTVMYDTAPQFLPAQKPVKKNKPR